MKQQIKGSSSELQPIYGGDSIKAKNKAPEMTKGADEPQKCGLIKERNMKNNCEKEEMPNPLANRGKEETVVRFKVEDLPVPGEKDL